MRAPMLLAAVALLMPQAAIYAQDKGYKVEFTLREGAGAAQKSARHYTFRAVGGQKAVLRMGSRVPTATGSMQSGVGGVGVNPLVNTQYTYLDVGVNIEFNLTDTGNKLEMHGNLDVSSIIQHDSRSGAAVAPNPTVGQTRLDLNSNVEPGKPTVIADVDDPVNMRQFQVEVTVTRI